MRRSSSAHPVQRAGHDNEPKRETAAGARTPKPSRRGWVGTRAASGIKRRIVESYGNIVVRLYCRIRFLIMNVQMLEEIEQYLPRRGKVLDVGCGFGFFSLFFASCSGERTLVSFDVDAERINMARTSAGRLGLSDRVHFLEHDILDYGFQEPVDGIVVLDLLHHIPHGTVPRILDRFLNAVADDGIVIVKDIESRPWYKVAFTWFADKLVDPWAPVRYYSRDEMIEMLDEAGFQVKYHLLRDVLPYPHVLYVCRKKPADEVPGAPGDRRGHAGH